MLIFLINTTHSLSIQWNVVDCLANTTDKCAAITTIPSNCENVLVNSGSSANHTFAFTTLVVLNYHCV